MNKIIGILLILLIAINLTGCNYQMVDFNYTFNYAIIQFPNGEIYDGKIKSWKDYEDGEQIQVTLKDGTVILTSSYNCTLMKKEVE